MGVAVRAEVREAPARTAAVNKRGLAIRSGARSVTPMTCTDAMEWRAESAPEGIRTPNLLIRCRPVVCLTGQHNTYNGVIRNYQRGLSVVPSIVAEI